MISRLGFREFRVCLGFSQDGEFKALKFRTSHKPTYQLKKLKSGRDRESVREREGQGVGV